MPTNKAKSVTIELTAKQQEMLRNASGSSYSELKVEFSKGRTARKPLSAKAAPKDAFGQGPGIAGGLPLG